MIFFLKRTQNKPQQQTNKTKAIQEGFSKILSVLQTVFLEVREKTKRNNFFGVTPLCDMTGVSLVFGSLLLVSVMSKRITLNTIFHRIYSKVSISSSIAALDILPLPLKNIINVFN